MANLPGKRIRDNGVFGTITDNPLALGSTAFNSPDLVDLDPVSGDHAIVTLDPMREHGAPEIVMITAHSASAQVATIQRGMFGTTTRSHPQGTLWLHTATNDDFLRVVTSLTRPTDAYRGQLIFETDTDKFVRRDVSDIWVDFPPVGTPRGIVATASRTTSFQLSATLQDVPSLSLTFATVAGRKYRCSFNSGVVIPESLNASFSAMLQIEMLLDGVVVDYDEPLGNPLYLGNNNKTYMEYVTLTAPSAANHTWKIRARHMDQEASDVGFISASAARPSYLILEDIGA